MQHRARNERTAWAGSQIAGVLAGLALALAAAPALAENGTIAPRVDPSTTIDRRVLDLELTIQRAEQRRALAQERHRLDRAEERLMNSLPSAQPEVPVMRPSCLSSGSRLARRC